MLHVPDRVLLLELQDGYLLSMGPGDQSMASEVLTEISGEPVLELIHPADREPVAQWLESGIGVSPLFRRNALDDPIRWFRLISVEKSPSKGRKRLLLAEFTTHEQMERTKRRLALILATESGVRLVSRSAELAAEVAGTPHAFVGRVEGPILVIRSSKGRWLPPPGTSIPLKDGPWDHAVAFARRILSDEPYGDLLTRIGARSCLVIPMRRAEREEVEGVLVVADRERIRLPEEAEEMLAMLATRTAEEMARERMAQAGEARTSGAFVPVLSPVMTQVLKGIGRQLSQLARNMPANSNHANGILEISRLLEAAADILSGAEDSTDKIDLKAVMSEVSDFLKVCAPEQQVGLNVPNNLPEVLGSKKVIKLLILALSLAFINGSVKISATTELDSAGYLWIVIHWYQAPAKGTLSAIPEFPLLQDLARAEGATLTYSLGDRSVSAVLYLRASAEFSLTGDFDR